MTPRAGAGGRFVVLAIVFEGGLGIVGLALAWLFGISVLEQFSWRPIALAQGLVATLPLMFVFVWLVRSELQPVREIRRLLERTLLPVLRPCTKLELAIIAISAGVGEEVLFRGYLQAHLQSLAGSVAILIAAPAFSAWIVASVLFGLAHWITPAYGLIATWMGMYLGWLWMQTGNLVVPIVAHAVYDYFAFLYYLRTDNEPNRAGTLRSELATSDSSLAASAPTATWEVAMKAAYIEETGPPENIHFGDLPKPQLTGSQVLVRVLASSVNPIDTYIRAGLVAMPIPKPYIVGCDLAGVVEEVGPGAKRYAPGDRVWGSNQGLFGRQGTSAEYAAVDECWLYPTPANVDDESAAALALVGITAHLGLVRDAQVKSGERVYVSGGSGGVGSAVVQIARAVGAKVITTAGCPLREQKAREFGADVVVNYKTGNLDQAIAEFAPQGVDIWWETVREPDLERAVPKMAKRGRIIVMAGRDAKPVLPLGPFYTRDCKLIGFAMFNATAEEQQESAIDLNRWLATGQLRANIDRVLPLSETAAAHRLQEENTIGKKGTLSGKIILKP